MSFQYLSSLDS